MSNLIFLLGFTQKESGNSPNFNFTRTSNFMLYGFFANGPALHFTYSQVIPKFGPQKCVKALGKKLLFTQTFFSFVSIASFYIFISKCEGKTAQGTLDELNNKLWPTYVTNLKIWPILQLINFTLVPPQLQVFYVNFMQLWWNVYLSAMKNKQGTLDVVGESPEQPLEANGNDESKKS